MKRIVAYLMMGLVAAAMAYRAAIGGDVEEKKAEKAEKKGIRAQVTLFDGSTVEVEEVEFVYLWRYTSSSTFVDRKRSKDFHYKEIVDAAELDRIVPVETIAQFEISWLEVPTMRKLGFEQMLITLKDEKQLTIKESLSATASFLTGVPPEDVTAEAYSNYTYMEGLAVIEGQRERFNGVLGTRLHPTDVGKAITNVVFLSPKK